MFLRFNACYSMEDRIKTFRFNSSYGCYMNKISHILNLSKIRLGGFINRIKRLEPIMVLWRERS